jgi:nucleoid-associated protein YgaU
MESKKISIVLVALATLSFSACSSSQLQEEGTTTTTVTTTEDSGPGTGTAAIAKDAGTDSAPSPATETSQQSTSASPAVGDNAQPVPIATAASMQAEAPPMAEAQPMPSMTPEIAQPSPTPMAVEQNAPMSPQSASAESGVQNDSSTEKSHFEEYKVKKGDTLMKIAFEIFGDPLKWKDIFEANKDQISNPNKIAKGSILKVYKQSVSVSVDKNGEKYLIKKGDTLGKISNVLYGSTSHWKQIWKLNKEVAPDPNRIFAGFYLYYVADSGVSSPPESDQSN